MMMIICFLRFFWCALQILRLFKRGVLFDIGVLEKFVKANIPDVTFLEAYRTTRRVLNVTVTSASDKGVRLSSFFLPVF